VKCLIIAAGQGMRLRSRGNSKPLVPLLGICLIERVIRAAITGGADDFYVVTGFEGEKLARFLGPLALRLKIAINIIHNEDWQQENGVSVLKAREALKEPFLLMMADHLVDPMLIQSLQKKEPKDGEVLLLVDSDMDNPLIDMEDVTKVQCKDGHILNIGKRITDFNGFDTGLFYCTPAMFDALEDSHRLHDDSSLSGAMRILAKEGRALSVPARGFWIDVDDEKAYQKAEKALLTTLQGKNNDGPVARYLNRPISTRISKHLVHYNITPNQISFVSFIFSIFAAGLFALGNYWFLALGGITAQFASIIDGSDGEVARLKYLSSDYGGWFDAVLDRYADAFLLFGLTWYVYSKELAPLVLFIGFLAIIGSFMLSYTADKYDGLMKERINKGIRVGRDLRVFMIFLGAILNQPYPVLILIAIWMNAETIHRMMICRES